MNGLFCSVYSSQTTIFPAQNYIIIFNVRRRTSLPKKKIRLKNGKLCNEDSVSEFWDKSNVARFANV